MTQSHQRSRHDSESHHGVSKVTSYKTVMTATAGVMMVGLFLLYGLSATADSAPFISMTTHQAFMKQFSPSPHTHPVLSTNAKPSMNPKGTRHTNSTSSTKENKIRLLCLVLTMEKDLDTKVKAVNSTWVTRCDKYFYIISSQRRHPDFLNIDIPDSRTNLVHKIQKTYNIVYSKYMNDFDFLLKADDDTYVIVENLKYLLSHYKGSEPGYLGFHFNKFVKNGYMSGGAGYVISNGGLRDMVEKGYRKGICSVQKNPDDPENSEDIETGKCLQEVGVPALSSLDVESRETFHPYPLEKHLLGGLPGYIFSWAKNPIQTGLKCCSRYTISFHYLSPQSIYFMHHLLYETTVYGLQDKHDDTGPVFKIGKVT